MIRKFLSNKDGNISVIFAFVILLLIFAVGIVVDISRVMKERENARDSTDAAIIATAIQMSLNENQEEVDVKAETTEYMLANVTEKYGKAKLLTGAFNQDQDEITVTGEVEVPTVFMGIFGRKTLRGFYGF